MDRQLKQMNILVVGPWRSGTTRLFNIIRHLVLQSFEEQDVQSNYFYKINNSENYCVNIAKIHHYTNLSYEWSDFIFGTSRNLYDIAASMLDCFDHWKRDKEIFKKNFKMGILDHIKDWENKMDYFIPYENYHEKYKNHIGEIIKILNINSDIEKA